MEDSDKEIGIYECVSGDRLRNPIKELFKSKW
jgi:hypothetical protein